MSNVIWNETSVEVKTKLSMPDLESLILQLEAQAQFELVQEVIIAWDEKRQAMLTLWLKD